MYLAVVYYSGVHDFLSSVLQQEQQETRKSAEAESFPNNFDEI